LNGLSINRVRLIKRQEAQKELQGDGQDNKAGELTNGAWASPDPLTAAYSFLRRAVARFCSSAKSSKLLLYGR